MSLLLYQLTWRTAAREYTSSLHPSVQPIFFLPLAACLHTPYVLTDICPDWAVAAVAEISGLPSLPIPSQQTECHISTSHLFSETASSSQAFIVSTDFAIVRTINFLIVFYASRTTPCTLRSRNPPRNSFQGCCAAVACRIPE